MIDPFATAIEIAAGIRNKQVSSLEFTDHTTIEFARLLARELGGFTPPPRYA